MSQASLRICGYFSRLPCPVLPAVHRLRTLTPVSQAQLRSQSPVHKRSPSQGLQSLTLCSLRPTVFGREPLRASVGLTQDPLQALSTFRVIYGPQIAQPPCEPDESRNTQSASCSQTATKPIPGPGPPPGYDRIPRIDPSHNEHVKETRRPRQP